MTNEFQNVYFPPQTKRFDMIKKRVAFILRLQPWHMA